MLKPKIGDLVRLKTMRVLSVDETNVGLDRNGSRFYVWPDMIEEILPRLLAVGDRVRHRYAHQYCGTILAVLGDDAFVDWGTTAYALGGLALNARERIVELDPA